MHPRKAADCLYKKIVGCYNGTFFVDAVSCRRENFLVVYIEDNWKGPANAIRSFEGLRVLVRSLSIISDVAVVCKKRDD